MTFGKSSTLNVAPPDRQREKAKAIYWFVTHAMKPGLR